MIIYAEMLIAGVWRHFALVVLLHVFVSMDTDSYLKGPEILYSPI